MKIGDVANIAGCPVETVRYYEKEGLLPVPARTGGNYRIYNDSHVERLLFICRCRTLDMSHEEIRQLLRSQDHPQERCDEINALVDRHIHHVSARIQTLQTLEAQLRLLRQSCNAGREVEHCGILHKLNDHTGFSVSAEEAANQPATPSKQATHRKSHSRTHKTKLAWTAPLRHD